MPIPTETPTGQRPPVPDSGGLAAALAAFGLWGILPVYWKLLAHLPPAVVTLYRLLWSFLLLLLFLLLRHELKGALRILKDGRSALAVVLCSALLAFNWFLFAWAVQHNVMVQVSLGYFLVPLFNMLAGMLFFGERLRPLQWGAAGIALAGVALQVVLFGGIPWLGLGVSMAFAAYGAVHKAVRYPAIPGFFLETLVVMPFVVPALLVAGREGPGDFFGNVPQACLLAGAGLATILPQVWFVYGAKKLRQTTLGLAQYIAPTLFLLVGVTVFNEPLRMPQIVSFGCIWLAIAVYSVGSLAPVRR